MKIKKILVLSVLAMAVFLQKDALAVIVINEFLADPPTGIAGDANRDGTRSSSQDEFVELLNTGNITEDLSLWSLWDSSALRHRFAQGTALPSLERLVIFGGGSPSGIPGLVFTASTGTLSLNNTGDQIILKNKLGIVVNQVGFSREADRDQSLTRFPEGNGSFHLHREVSSSGLIFSPGTDVEGRTRNLTPTVPEPWTGLSFGIGLLIAGVVSRKSKGELR